MRPRPPFPSCSRRPPQRHSHGNTLVYPTLPGHTHFVPSTCALWVCSHPRQHCAHGAAAFVLVFTIKWSQKAFLGTVQHPVTWMHHGFSGHSLLVVPEASVLYTRLQGTLCTHCVPRVICRVAPHRDAHTVLTAPAAPLPKARALSTSAIRECACSCPTGLLARTVPIFETPAPPELSRRHLPVSTTAAERRSPATHTSSTVHLTQFSW